MLRDLGAVADDLAEWASGTNPRVPTGYPSLDLRTHGGIGLGELAILLARTGVGKTYMGLNIVRNNPTTPTIFFSLEMHGRYILSRLAAMDNRTTTTTIEEQMARSGRSVDVEGTVQTFQRLRIVDETGLSFDDMLQYCADYAAEEGDRPQLVVIDFLALVSSFSMDNVVKSLAQEAKVFAREANAAVVLLHQANRGMGRNVNHGHRPLSMLDLEYGGEQMGDYIIGAYRPALDPAMPPFEKELRASEFYIQLLKSRAGAGLDELGTQHYYETSTGLIVPLV